MRKSTSIFKAVLIALFAVSLGGNGFGCRFPFG